MDHKPDQICSDCLTQLKSACEFKQRCETSDLFLKNITFERKFQIFDDADRTIDDFIDTNLFDQDYILDPDYMNDPTEDDLKPDFDSLESKGQVDAGEANSVCKSIQVDSNGHQIEKRKFSRNTARFIKCSTCSDTFAGPMKLIQHARDVHQDSKPFKCSQFGCERSYQNPKALKVHRKIHESVKPFKCDECQAEFHVKANLLAHVRTTHTGEKFKCNFLNCGKSFSTVSYFKQHQMLHIHGDDLPRPFTCSFLGCDKTFVDKNSFRSHQMVHNEKKFGCEICGCKFRTTQSLKIHHLKHTDIKQFTCHICGVLFKYKNQCYDHVRAHTAKRELECFHCSKKFIKKTLLAAHMQTHLTIRKFNCSECNKSFKTYNCLYAHRRRHQARIAKFSCASCDKNFTSRSDLTNHVRTHTQEKQFACHIKGCSKIFVHKANLNVHIKSHSEKHGFNCDVCHKSLANSNALRVHLNKVHKAEKKFGCHSCTLKFASPQLLRIHEEIHKPKKFACTFCNQRYNFEADLNRHLAKMHQDHENKESSDKV